MFRLRNLVAGLYRVLSTLTLPLGESSMSTSRVVESPLWDDYLRLVASSVVAQPPVNFRSRRREEIAAAADYAVCSGNSVIGVMEHNKIPITGTILEIGPGSDFGASLILGERCKKLILADRFMAGWQPGYHSEVYRETQRRLGRPSRLLDALVAAASYEGIIETVSEPAFRLTSIQSDAIDLVHSNAVLEHVHPLEEAIGEFYRVTSPGGYGAHQVDFRYHRNLDLPLEHLLFTEPEYAKVLAATHCETGCQTRVKEVAEMFQKAGFDVVKIDVNMTASEAYMRDFLPRLRRSTVSTYRNCAADELAKLGARIFVRKPAH